MSEKINNNNQRGLTLVELALVTALLGVVSLLLFSTLSGIIRTKRDLEASRIQQRTAQYVIKRISRELENRMLLPVKEGPASSAASGGNPAAPTATPNPVDEDEAFPLYLIGTDERAGEYDRDRIRFVSAGSGQEIYQGTANHGIVQIEYRLEDVAEGEQTKTVLVRDEIPAGVKDNNILQARRVLFPVSENVTSLNFRYLYRGKWLNLWNALEMDTDPDDLDDDTELPDAIEISISVKAPDNSDNPNNTQLGNTQLRREAHFRTAVSMLRGIKGKR